MEDDRIPVRSALTLTDYGIGVALVVLSMLVMTLLRAVPDWLASAIAAAAGVGLWFILIVARKK